MGLRATWSSKECSCTWQELGTKWSLKVSSKPNHLMILLIRTFVPAHPRASQDSFASLLPSNKLKWTATKKISSHPDKNSQSSCHRCQALCGQMMHFLWWHLTGETLQRDWSQWVRYSSPWQGKRTPWSELWWKVLHLKNQAHLSCCYFLIGNIASDISPACTVNLYTPRTLWNILY